MRRTARLLAGAGAGALLALAALPGPAAAGPCEQQINDVSRQFENNPAAGGTPGATLAGNAPGAIQNDAPMPREAAPSGAVEPAGEAGVKGKAVATTMAGNAPGSQSGPVDPAAGKATSAQDVRLQQQGKPTMTQGGRPDADEGRLRQARAVLSEARELDKQGSDGCMAKLDEFRQLMGGG